MMFKTAEREHQYVCGLSWTSMAALRTAGPRYAEVVLLSQRFVSTKTPSSRSKNCPTAKVRSTVCSILTLTIKEGNRKKP